MFFYDIDKLCLDKITVNTILWHGKTISLRSKVVTTEALCICLNQEILYCLCGHLRNSETYITMMFLKQTYQFSFLIYVLLTYLSIKILNVAAKTVAEKSVRFFPS